MITEKIKFYYSANFLFMFLTSLLLIDAVFSFAAPVSQKDKPTHSDEKKDKGHLAVFDDEQSLLNVPSDMPRPVLVSVNFILDEITKINELAGTFEGTVSMEYGWMDPSLAFDPNTYGTFRQKFCLEKATEILTKIWNPEVAIVNMNDKTSKVKQCVLIYSTGHVVLVQRIAGEFKNKFMLNSFPFDTQNLQLRVMPARYENAELQFVQNQEQIDHSGIHQDVKYEGWTIKGLAFENSMVRGLSNKYMDRFVINVVLKRLPFNQLFSFTPLLLIVLLPTIITLYTTVETATRLSYWSGAILALIALSFTLTLRYPALTSDSLLSQFIGIIFVYEFLMICLSLTFFNPNQSGIFKNPYIIPEVNKCLRWAIPLGFIILITSHVLQTMLSMQE